MRIYLIVFTVVFMAVFITPPAFAKKDELKAQETPITKWMDAENAMIDTLPRQNQKVFFVLRNKANVIRSVNMVERDIKNAVKSCAKENKEISSDIKSRFKDWQRAVNPILKEADKFCLMKSMDRSENQLVGLLQDILLPEEVVRKRIERAEEASKKDKKS